MKYIFALIMTVISLITFGQYNFTCPKNITFVGCDSSVLAIRVKIADIKENTNTYYLHNFNDYKDSSSTNCFPYSPLAGTSAQFTEDDVWHPGNVTGNYTAGVGIGFSHDHYGRTYNSYKLSANGIVSFNVGQFAGFAQFQGMDDGAGMLETQGAPVDLPDPRHPDMYNQTGVNNKAFIGFYTDMNPALPAIPGFPNKDVRYGTFGITPHRQVIVTYNDMPHFTLPGRGCDTMVHNAQIKIQEGTAMEEVLVKDAKPCRDWNVLAIPGLGRKMIAIQNENATQAMMPPNRRMSSPPWGTHGMNEGWRYVPATGNSLFKRAELFDLAGNLVVTGTTTTLPNGFLEVTYPLVSTGVQTFVSRSTYRARLNAALEVYFYDTITVNKIYAGDDNCRVLGTGGDSLLYPTPDRRKKLWVNNNIYSYYPSKRGKYTIEIFNSSGQLIWKEQRRLDRTRYYEQTPIVTSGWYIMRISDERRNQDVVKFRL